MDWTTEEKLRHLLRLPWTFDRELTPEGDSVLRVREIPSATGSGTTPEEAEADVWASLRASLETYLHFGDTIPLPRDTVLPWLRPSGDGVPPIVIRQELGIVHGGETAGMAGSGIEVK